MNQNLSELNIKFKMILKKNQKVIRNDSDELVVKNYPKKKQPIREQLKIKPPKCPSCKQNIQLEFDKGYYSLNIISTNINIRWIINYLNKNIFFLLDYHILRKI